MSAPKKLFVKTYGCQMNVYDSERMAEALGSEGYVQVQTAEEADMILLNTCHIREKAAEKVYSELGRYKTLKSEKPGLKIGVAGCVAQAEGEEIMRRQPMVDLVVGPQSYHRLPELEAKARTGAKALDTDFPEEDKFEHLKSRPKAKRGPTAFLTVQEGCDKFCSFCVVPYTRGAEVSRPVAQVLREARNLADAGVREITLLGQNVNAYHGVDDTGHAVGLGALLHMLSDIDGLDRLRYTTSHPRDMDEGLIRAHRDLDTLMPYLHLPVQSGSDRILRAMNRRHTRDDYLRLIERIRAARPDIALSGDFITGFPGETDEDFADTLNIVREVGYASAFSFKYSPRPGTPGAKMSDRVVEGLAMERLAELQALIRDQQVAFNRSCVGSTLDVLLEKTGREPGQLGGRSPYLQAVHLDADPELIGTIQKVRISSVRSNSLDGELVANPAKNSATLKMQSESSPAKGASV